MVPKGGVETAQAGEAAGQGDLADGQRRVGEHLLGCQQFAREQVLQRRDAQAVFKNTAQMAVAHAQTRGEPRHRGAAFDGPGPVLRVVQPLRGLLHEDVARVLGGPVPLQRCEFRTATQAGPEARLFGLGRVLEEAAVLAPRRAHAADRPAIDASGGDRGKEPAIKPGVV